MKRDFWWLVLSTVSTTVAYCVKPREAGIVSDLGHFLSGFPPADEHRQVSQVAPVALRPLPPAKIWSFSIVLCGSMMA